MIKSHEYARKLSEMAEFLIGREEFEFDSEPFLYHYFWSGHKDAFLATARGLGSGKKEWTDTDFKFTVEHGVTLTICIPRSAVCKKVQEEKWECEPLLSQEEEELGGGGVVGERESS